AASPSSPAPQSVRRSRAAQRSGSTITPSGGRTSTSIAAPSSSTAAPARAFGACNAQRQSASENEAPVCCHSSCESRLSAELPSPYSKQVQSTQAALQPAACSASPSKSTVAAPSSAAAILPKAASTSLVGCAASAAGRYRGAESSAMPGGYLLARRPPASFTLQYVSGSRSETGSRSTSSVPSRSTAHGCSRIDSV